MLHQVSLPGDHENNVDEDVTIVTTTTKMMKKNGHDDEDEGLQSILLRYLLVTPPIDSTASSPKERVVNTHWDAKKRAFEEQFYF